MKPWIYKPILLLLLVGLVSISSYANGRRDFTKTIKKEFDITSNGEVGLSNQFGKIEINTWDKNRVKVAITIIIRTDSESRAQEEFDRIDFDFSNGKDYVKVSTEIESRKSKWWGGSWSNNSCDFAINYEVFLPKTVELDLKNRHGEIYIVAMAGNAEIDIAHGSITADGFAGTLDLEMAHSNGTIVSAKNLDADISHSSIQFKKTGNINMETAHSNVDIDHAKRIKLDARHTNFEIGDIDEMKVESQHSNFEIESANSIFSESQHSTYDVEQINKIIDFDFSHGGATIDRLEKGFEEVNLIGSHASYKIRVADNTNFQLEIYGTHAGIRYPSDMNITYEKDKNNEQEIKGSKGGSAARGVIKARLSHGGLRIR